MFSTSHHFYLYTYVYTYTGPVSPQTITLTLTYPVTLTSVLTGTLAVVITDDEIAEMDGIYNVTLESSQDRLTFTDTTSEITILDNDSELCDLQG